MQRGEWDRRLHLRSHTLREHRPGEHACDALNCDNPQPTHRAPTAFFKEWVPAPIVIPYKCLLPKTNVVTLAELLAGFGSKLGELTTAVFVTDAGIGGIEIRTVKLTVAEAPLAMFAALPFQFS
jgi:hypothetical protein